MTHDEIEIIFEAYRRISAIGLDWATQEVPGWVGDSGDETQPVSVEEVYPKIDPKSMAVKSDTEADRERLWQSVLDYSKG